MASRRIKCSSYYVNTRLSTCTIVSRSVEEFNVAQPYLYGVSGYGLYQL